MSTRDERVSLRIMVTPDAKEVVREFAEKWDMLDYGVASRIYMWFSEQPEDVQKWVMGMTTGKESHGMREFAHQLLLAAQPHQPEPGKKGVRDPRMGRLNESGERR